MKIKVQHKESAGKTVQAKWGIIQFDKDGFAELDVPDSPKTVAILADLGWKVQTGKLTTSSLPSGFGVIMHETPTEIIVAPPKPPKNIESKTIAPTPVLPPPPMVHVEPPPPPPKPPKKPSAFIINMRQSISIKYSTLFCNTR